MRLPPFAKHFLALLCFVGALAYAHDCEHALQRGLLEKTSTRVVVVDPYSSGALYGEAAKALGWEIFVLHSAPELLPFAAASYRKRDYDDQHEIFNKKAHWDELLPTVGLLKPDLILAGTDSGVIMADYLAEKLQIPHRNVFDLREARRDKFISNMVLKSHPGIRSAEQVQSTEWAEIREWKENIHQDWPVVVKPTHGAAGENVRAVYNYEQLALAFNEIKAKPVNTLGLKNHQVVVQEFLHGTEYIVEVVSTEGDHFLGYVMEYDNVELPNGAFIKQNTRLLSLEDPRCKVLLAYAKRVLNALGTKYGPSHLEMKVADWKNPDPVLVEPNPRMAGAFLPSLIKDATGFDEARLSLLSFGDPARFRQEMSIHRGRPKTAYQATLIAFEGGRVLTQEVVDRVHNLRSVRDPKDVHWHFKVGEIVTKTTSLFDVLADVDLVHEDPAVVEADYQTLLEIQKSF
jgi:biotin carboxylase